MSTARLDEVRDDGCHILHVDMDAFYVSVEMRRDPSLRNKPVVVGGTGGRGVVSSAGYLARECGVRSAMPIAHARRLCPHGVFLPVDMAAYQRASSEVMDLLAQITPAVEQLSVDEAFLDVAGVRRLLGRPAAIGELIRRRIAAELGLTCSVGAAGTKFVAKLASTVSKPDGMRVVPVAKTLEFLHPLPVRALWGVGARTHETLRALGIGTVGDVAGYPERSLRKSVGVAAARHLHELAHGRDPRRVSGGRVDKSVGAEQTYDNDLTSHEAVRRELLRLSGVVATRLRRANYQGRTIALKVRFADFTMVGRSRTLGCPTDLARELYVTACSLWDSVGVDQPRVRLLGVRAEQLVAEHDAVFQLELDAGDDRWSDAEGAMDEVTRRFGPHMLRPAALIDPADSGARPSDRAPQTDG